MKILPSSGVDIRNLYGHAIQGVQTDSEGVQARQRDVVIQDRVEISPDAQDIERAREYAQTLPEVRADKVASLKEQIASGAYHVDSRDIADRMLQQAASFPG